MKPPRSLQFAPDVRLDWSAAVAALACAGLAAWRYGPGAAACALAAASVVYWLKRPRSASTKQEPREDAAILERLNLATQVGGISAWELNIPARRFVWDTNRPMAFGLEDLPIDQLAEKLISITHPEDRGLLANSVQRALANGQLTYSHRFRIARDGHPIRHMQTFARIVTDTKGGPDRLLGATWDVTNEVQTTEMLQRQAELEHKLLERYGIATQAAGIRSWEAKFEPRHYAWHDNFDLDWLREHDEDPLKAVTKLTHPDDRNCFNDAMKAAIAANSDIVSYRYRFRKRDGSWDHRQNYARLFFDDNGKASRALGVSWSITKEVEATEQLTISERRLERASRSSSEGHWEWDLISQQAWHSASFHELLGYPQGRLLLPISEATALLRHPEDAARHKDLIARHVAAGDPYVFEGRYRMASGEFRWFKIRGMSELDATGTPLRATGSIQDIHDQKLAEDALQLAQRRFERAIHGTQDGLWEVEADGSDAWYSPRLSALLGFQEEELKREPGFLNKRIHPADHALTTNAILAHYRDNTPYDVEARFQTKEGEYRWFRARAVAERDADGKPLRLSGSMQDVTEARRARDELMAATEAAHAANRAKSAFLANVSHEIRTPMNGILGMTGLMIETELDHTQRDYAETIRASAESLLTVINDLLDFSKIEAGKLDIESLELDLRSNVEDVGCMMAFQAAAKKLELIVNVRPDVPQFVWGDPQRIRQCLINLVGNAIKFTQSGEVVIEVSNAGSSDGKTITRFEVRDTGIGISSESMRNLFQPFTQADASTTRHFGGTGLGLSIVHRLAKMMGGDTGAASQLGIGSTFWFALPMKSVDLPDRVSPETALAPDKRVLVVDDNHTNRRVLVGQLETAGFSVEAAANGADALAAMRQALAAAQPFDIALIDFQMPEMDGAMLGEKINSDSQFSRTRTVMLTSMDRHGDIRQFAALGFAAYLAKPVRTGELFACLKRMITRESPGLITRNALQEEASRQRFHGRVLLVEDNVVNQKVARQFLTRLGCDVEIADNGEQAVKAFEAQPFGLVLMDLQMPVMDGYAATRRIRDFEGWRTRTPIVALTANAMTGQMERCIAAGMDDFLTKPLQVQRLREILSKFGMAAEAALAPTRVDELLAAANNATAPVDIVELRAVTGNDDDFVLELTAAFIACGEQVMRDCQGALRADDRTALARAAHKLRGASANLYARDLAELCAALETQANSLTTSEIIERIAAIEAAIKQTIDFLNAVASTHVIDGKREIG